MPIRRRLAAVVRREPDPLDVFRWSDDGLDHLLGEPHYQTPVEARRAWETYRRAVWAETHRFRIPGAAAVYDGLTTSGREQVYRSWNLIGPFDLAGALEALAEDRAALAAFRTTRSARAIADYLELFAADLDQVEQTARDLADWSGPEWRRPYPAHLNTKSCYGRGELK